MTIRAATPDDGPALGRLGADLVRIHHEFDRRRFMSPTPHTERGYAAFLRSQIGSSDAFVLVASRGGDVIGYSYGTIEGPDWMTLRGPAGVIHDLVVDPAHRGNGIGRSLLEATVAALSARGAPRVVLSTAERNEAAQRLFARAGFRRTMVEMARDLQDDDAR